METLKCIGCETTVEYDDELPDGWRGIGESGNYLCAACDERQKTEETAVIAAVERELEAAIGDKSTFRGLCEVAVRQAKDRETHCHLRACGALISAGDIVITVYSAHAYTGTRDCCSVKCAVEYLEVEDERE